MPENVKTLLDTIQPQKSVSLPSASHERVLSQKRQISITKPQCCHPVTGCGMHFMSPRLCNPNPNLLSVCLDSPLHRHSHTPTPPVCAEMEAALSNQLCALPWLSGALVGFKQGDGQSETLKPQAVIIEQLNEGTLLLTQCLSQCTNTRETHKLVTRMHTTCIKTQRCGCGAQPTISMGTGVKKNACICRVWAKPFDQQTFKV